MSDALNLALTITAADAFSGVMRKFERRIIGAGDAAKRVQKDYDTMINSVNRGIKSLAVGGYIAAKMRPGISAAAELQEELIGIRAEMGGANSDAASLAKHMTEVRKTAFGVQAYTPFNIGQIVALEKELVKAGANVQDVIGERGAAAAAAALATYEKLDPVMTGQALIGIGTPFKIAASGYADLADQISRAASASTTGAAEIAESAKYAAGPLASMQRSSNEMLALVAVMAQQGVTGSMAGTSLKNFFLKAAEQETFKNTNGELKTTAEIIEILRQKTEGMGNAQRSGILTKVFGQEGLPVALALLNQGKGSFEDIVKAMEDAKPLAEKLEEIMGGMNRQINSLGGTATSTLSVLFEPALAPLTELIAKTNEWVAALGKAALENENIGKAVTYGVGGLATGLGAYGLAKIFQGGLAGLRVMKGLRGLGGTAAGIATGKAVEAATGVAPVFVTNWPGDGLLGGGMGSAAGAAGGTAAGGVAAKVFSKAKTTLALLRGTPLSKLGMFGAGALGTAGAGVMAAGAGGYGFGTLIDRQVLDKTETGREIKDAIGEGIAHVLAFFGSDEAWRAIDANERTAQRQSAELVIRLEGDGAGRARVQRMRSDNLDMSVDSGLSMMGP